MRKNKVYFRFFGTAITVILLAVFISGCSKEITKDPLAGSTSTTLPVAETFPANQAEAVAINPIVAVTFDSNAATSVISASTLTLKEKNATINVEGTLSADGTTINFTPSADLKPNTAYTAILSTSADGSSGNTHADKTWTFTTGNDRQSNTFSVSSVSPSNNATSVSLDAKPKVTFNTTLSSTRTSALHISLMQGSTPVLGSVSYSGRVATFTPASSLMANTVYTGNVTYGTGSGGGESDDDNNTSTGTNLRTWSFTTAGSGGGTGPDVTPPTVSSAMPANNATNVAVNSSASITFSEAMNASSISSATFTLSKGSAPVSGTVSYSGNTAKFTPSASLTAGTVYTGTITTGVTDVAGNKLAANYTWSFTTGSSTSTAVSFASQVLPILQSKCMPCHSGSNPPAGVVITSYASISGLSNGQIDYPSMYSRMGVTPAEILIIKAWIAAGRPNN